MFYYVLVRHWLSSDEFSIVYTGGDPLFGRGSWDQFSGPFDTWAEAEACVQGVLDRQPVGGQ